MADYYHEAALLEKLPPGRGMTVTISGREIPLFNVDGTVYAMDNSCLHNGESLGQSNLHGKIVTCRGHGWKYDVTTGVTFHVPDYGVSSYAAKVVDGKIWVAIK